MDLSIIIVNWNVCGLLRRCLASIEANRDELSLEVIVVDNASSDGSVAMVEREFPRARLIASQENLGYTGGNNVGADQARGRYLFILNPDTEIVGKALEQMVTYLDEHTEVGVLGPQLRYPDGSIQSSRRRFPQIVTAFSQGTPLSWRWSRDNNKFKHIFYMADSSDDEVQSVDWLVGAALMIRRRAWREIGPFDERFFMYSDEVDWCHRCRDGGWEIHYLPAAQVIHHEGRSSDQIPVAARIQLHRSRVRYYRKYFGVGWATVLWFYFMMNYVWILAEETAKWVIGRHREKHHQQMRACWQILKSGLR